MLDNKVYNYMLNLEKYYVLRYEKLQNFEVFLIFKQNSF